MRSTETGMTWGCGQAHHWLLEDPVGERIPGKCRECGAERTWPALGVRAEGRPFITSDPLLPRTMVGGWGLTDGMR